MELVHESSLNYCMVDSCIIIKMLSVWFDLATSILLNNFITDHAQVLVRGLQPGGHEADRLGQRRRAGEAVVHQHEPLRRQPRGQGQRLLRQVQPQLLLPPSLRLSRSLRPLLWPQVGKTINNLIFTHIFSLQSNIFPVAHHKIPCPGRPSSLWTCLRVTARRCPTLSSWTARTSCPPPPTPSSSCGTSTRATAPAPSQVRRGRRCRLHRDPYNPQVTLTRRTLWVWPQTETTSPVAVRITASTSTTKVGIRRGMEETCCITATGESALASIML